MRAESIAHSHACLPLIGKISTRNIQGIVFILCYTLLTLQTFITRQKTSIGTAAEADKQSSFGPSLLLKLFLPTG